MSAIGATPVESILQIAEEDALVAPGGSAPVSFLPQVPGAPPAAPGGDGGFSLLPGSGGGASEPAPGGFSLIPGAAGRFRTRAGLAAVRKRAGRRWREFVSLQQPVESRYKRAYRSWVATVKRGVLSRFDEAADLEKALRARVKQVDAGAILPVIGDAQSTLKDRVLPIATGALEAIYDFTLQDLGGVATFHIDDPTIQAYLNRRMRVLLDSAPQTLLQNLSAAIREGVQAGETVQQLRKRIAAVFDIASSSAKALTVARTESAALLDGVRDQMFGLAGVVEEQWASAGDEVVRATHVQYDEAGPQPREANYLDISGRSGGTLAHPHDLRCTLLDELINCRCLKVPTA